MVDTSHTNLFGLSGGYAVPVYRGWPDRPYKVIGSIQMVNPEDRWNDGDTERAASLAKQKKADAIIMRYGAEFGVGAITGAAADPRIMSVNQVACLAIRWKPETEIASERSALEAFRAEFQKKHPELRLSDDLLKTGAEMIGAIGATLDSSAGASKLDDTLVTVLQSSEEGKTSKWIFKGTIRSSAIASSYTEVASGLATVTRDGETIAIIAEPGKTELILSGSVKEGRLAGQLSVSSGATVFSGKAEGVLVSHRISVSGQAQTADGLVQCMITFIR